MSLSTKFFKEDPTDKIPKELPLMDGSWVYYRIEKTEMDGGGWLVIPFLSPVRIKVDK